MKALITLVAVQAVILVALFVRVNSLDGEVEQVQRVEPEPVYAQPSSTPQPAPVTVAGYTDEDRLREIIREELALALEDFRSVAGNTVAGPAQPLRSGRDYELQRDAVQQSIDFYVSTGQITEQQMAQLQIDIAQLNPDDRRAMMGAIVRAMNTGQLEGRL